MSQSRGILNAKRMVLKIEKRQLDNGVTVIQLGGRVALGGDSDQIQPEVEAAIRQGAKIVILDLNAVNHIDSTGIGIMAYCFGKATQAQSELRIAGAKGNVLSAFQITRLVHVIPFYPDVDSAVQGNGRLE